MIGEKSFGTQVGNQALKQLLQQFAATRSKCIINSAGNEKVSKKRNFEKESEGGILYRCGVSCLEARSPRVGSKFLPGQISRRYGKCL